MPFGGVASSSTAIRILTTSPVPMLLSQLLYTLYSIENKNTGLELIQLMTTVLVCRPGSQHLAHVYGCVLQNRK